MTKELKELLETVVTGNNDLMQETIDASKVILNGGYEGHKEDVECLEGTRTGFELETLLSQGKWYWQDELKMKKNYTLEGKIIKYLRNRYPKTRINSIERLNIHETYYAVKCNVTELFASGHWDDVSTFFIDIDEIK